MPLNLLRPDNLSDAYVNQLRQTIDAYDPQHVVLGEALQNALDAVNEAGRDSAAIGITIDFDERSIEVTDDGVGFPNDSKLLYLGGTSKLGRGFHGMIGAGLKVVLFSTEEFSLRARSGSGTFRVDIDAAHRFDDEDDRPTLEVDDHFEADPDPLKAIGTVVRYRFPETNRVFESCFDRIAEACLPKGDVDPLLDNLAGSVEAGDYPTRLAALLGLFLRRFTYVGDVREPFGKRPGPVDLTLSVTVVCSDPDTIDNELLRGLADDETETTFEVKPGYVTVEDTAEYVTRPRVPVFTDQLGRGGQNLTRTAHGFNHIRLTTPTAYEGLLVNANGELRGNARRDIEEFREKLFNRINGISLTIGRIPEFERCLPGGSRRVVAANGVVTIHDLNFDSGRNQQYVRCFDLVVDVDAKLNYGKTQITDPHLINRIRRYVNTAYGAVISNAARNFVGRIADDDTDDEDEDIFLEREDLLIPDFTLRKVPTSEQDVIALFFELAGRGHFPDYQVYGLSSKDRYDSRAAIATEARPASKAFDPQKDRDLRVVEFKHTASEVVRDFDRDIKSSSEIHLLIAWTEGKINAQHFYFEDIEHSKFAKKNPSRVFPGVTRYIQDSKTGDEVQVLLLDSFVEGLREEQDGVDV